jgi:hypothetical protein
MAKVESQISEQEWSRWLDPFNATQRIKQAGLADDERAIGWLAARLSNGELRGAGYVPCHNSERDTYDWHLCMPSAHVWEHVRLIPWRDDFWVSGTYSPKIDENDLDLSVLSYARRELGPKVPDGFDHTLWKFRFDPIPIDEFCSPTPSTSNERPAAKIDKGRRGPKRKDWWDHLWIEMIRRIRAQTLKPKNQASLQAEMEDFVRDDLGTEPGDSTLKPMAAKLFKFLEEISGEIGEN